LCRAFALVLLAATNDPSDEYRRYLRVLLTHSPSLTGFMPFADLLFRSLRAPCEHHRQRLCPGRRWLRDQSRSRLCFVGDAPCLNLTRLIRAKRRNSSHRAQNAEALCGLLASSQPTILTTINGRLNVRNAIILNIDGQVQLTGGGRMSIILYPTAVQHSESIQRPNCSKCRSATQLFGIEAADRPGYDLLTFVCPVCEHIETAVRKAA
jgi:hypothetical protein